MARRQRTRRTRFCFGVGRRLWSLSKLLILLRIVGTAQAALKARVSARLGLQVTEQVTDVSEIIWDFHYSWRVRPEWFRFTIKRQSTASHAADGGNRWPPTRFRAQQPA